MRVSPFRIAFALLTLAGLLFSAASSFGQTTTFGPFSVTEESPETITMSGPIDTGAALNFRRILSAAPEAELLVLNSPGGAVDTGLLIADDVHQRGMATFIPAGNGCYSACAYIFFAGTERKAEGEIGVHQLSSASPDLISAQLSISDIIDLLARFDTPMEVLTVMFRTPPDDMHIFTPQEVADYGIDRGPSDPEDDRPDEAVAAEMAPDETETIEETSRSLAESAPDLGASSEATLSAIESYARRPTRMAVYPGLDLYGSDIAQSRQADAPACARECLLMQGQCKAFTFNIDERLRTGPNCFLKSTAGTRDGNSVAISGELLTSSDADPRAFSMGTIDPNEAIFDDVDIPFGDLSRAPETNASSQGECRLACVANEACAAFTFVEQKGQCWLKGTLNDPSFQPGMVSGVKSMTHFDAPMIVELD